MRWDSSAMRQTHETRFSTSTRASVTSMRILDYEEYGLKLQHAEECATAEAEYQCDPLVRVKKLKKTYTEKLETTKQSIESRGNE